jgi:hypothetical protein
MMTTIYKAASKVLVRLGREADEDARGLEYIEDLVLHSHSLLISVTSEVKQDVQKCIEVLKLCTRPYWKRLWIIREVIYVS